MDLRTLVLGAILLGGDPTEKYSEITIQTQSPTEVKEAVKGKAEVLSVKEFEVPKYPDPTIDITGDEDIIPFGELIILGVKEDNVSDKVVQKEYKWRVLENGKDKPKVKIENNTVTFGAGAPVDWKNPKPKSITVLLSVTYLYKDGETILVKSSDILSSNLNIGGQAPEPTPNPPKPPVPPVPKPDPVFPDTKFNRANEIYQNLKTKELDSNVMKSLAQIYANTSEKIKKGEFNTRPDKSPFASSEEQVKLVLATLAGESNQIIPSDTKDKYKSAITKVEDVLFELITSGKIKSATELAEFCIEVSLAMKEL